MADRPEIDAKINAEVEEHWLPLLKTDGQWDEQKIRNELHDLVFVLSQVDEVYEYITGGKLSKPMYYADVVKAAFDDAVNDAMKDAAADRLEEIGHLEHALAAAERAAKFGALVLKEHRNDGEPGDVDGGWLQATAEECGLIERFEVQESCSNRNCYCEPGDDCFRFTESGCAALASIAAVGEKS